MSHVSHMVHVCVRARVYVCVRACVLAGVYPANSAKLMDVSIVQDEADELISQTSLQSSAYVTRPTLGAGGDAGPL